MYLLVVVQLLDVLNLHMDLQEDLVVEMVERVHLHQVTVALLDGKKHVNRKQGEKC